ncbi:MAG: histidine kinase [Gemmatimonadetes bacterium]|nr:histidine kinase [Gemmatimonadota bacterium]
MSWQYTPFLVPLLVSASICAALGVFALRHRVVRSAGSFVLLMAASAWWSLAYAVYQSSTSLGTKLLWAQALQVGAILVPLAWALLVLRYTERERWLTPWAVALISFVPALTLALMLANGEHGMFWSRFVLVRRAGRIAVDSRNAWGFWLHVGYSWLLLFASVGLLGLKVLRSPHLYRSQAASLLFAALIPWVGNVLHLSGLVRFPANPMPFLFTLSGALFAWAIFRYRFLDILPVARERLVEEMHEAVVVVDEAGRVLDLNGAARRAFGFAGHEAVGRPARDALPALAHLLDAPAGAASGEVELGGGEEGRRFEARATPLLDGRGHRTGTLLVLRDLSERSAAEAAITLQRAYLEQLFDSAGEGIALLDAEDRVLSVNSAFERIFGYPAGEARGRAINELIVPAGMEDEARALTGRVSAGERIEADTVRMRRDGTRVDVAVQGTPVYSGGVQVATYGIYRDVTAQKRMDAERAELLDRERQARAEAEKAGRRAAFFAEVGTLLNATLDYETTYKQLARMAIPELCDYCLIDEVDEAGGTRRIAVAHVDPAHEKLLIPDHRNPPDVDLEKSPVMRVVRSGVPILVPEVSQLVLDRIALDDDHRWRMRTLGLRSYVVVPLMARGRTLGAITLLASVSGRRFGPADLAAAEELARRAALAMDNARLYGEAIKAVRARDNVLGVVSHDMRNPLATILLNTTSVLDGPVRDKLDDWKREQLQWVVRSVEQMDHLIDDLLAVTKIESGQLTVHPEPHAAAALVRDGMLMLTPIAEERGITLTAEVAPDAGWARADRHRILRVFSNLVGNALKFTREGGSVCVQAERDGAAVRFRVRDTGYGIAPEHLGHVFDRFWQAGKHSRDGAGLGLPIARGIVEAHGGTIRVASEPDVGTVVEFTLPSAPIAEARIGG